jgi:hypothetical protein
MLRNELIELLKEIDTLKTLKIPYRPKWEKLREESISEAKDKIIEALVASCNLKREENKKEVMTKIFNIAYSHRYDYDNLSEVDAIIFVVDMLVGFYNKLGE